MAVLENSVLCTFCTFRQNHSVVTHTVACHYGRQAMHEPTHTHDRLIDTSSWPLLSSNTSRVALISITWPLGDLRCQPHCVRLTVHFCTLLNVSSGLGRPVTLALMHTRPRRRRRQRRRRWQATRCQSIPALLMCLR